MAWNLITSYGINNISYNYNDSYNENDIKFQQYENKDEQRGIALFDFENVIGSILDLSNQNLNSLNSIKIDKNSILTNFQQIDFSMNNLSLEEIYEFINKFPDVNTIYIDQISGLNVEKLKKFQSLERKIKIFTFSLKNEEFQEQINKQIPNIIINSPVDLYQIPQILDEYPQQITFNNVYLLETLTDQILDQIDKKLKQKVQIVNLTAQIDSKIKFKTQNLQIQNLNKITLKNFLSEDEITQKKFDQLCQQVSDLTFKFQQYDEKSQSLLIYDNCAIFSDYSFNQNPEYKPNIELIRDGNNMKVNILSEIKAGNKLIIQGQNKLKQQIQHHFIKDQGLQLDTCILIKNEQKYQEKLLNFLQNFNSQNIQIITSNGLNLQSIDEAQFYLLNDLIQFYVIYPKKDAKIIFYYIQNDMQPDIIFSNLYQVNQRFGTQEQININLQEQRQFNEYYMQLNDQIIKIY